MTWYRTIMTAFIWTISFSSFAQTSIPFSRSSYIVPYKLEISFNKTTNLVFPASITSIDIGSQDIIVGKAAGVENILRVKADTKVFDETNLSVITTDGKLYSFLVNFNNNPPYLNVNISNTLRTGAMSSGQNEGKIPSMRSSEQDLNKYSQKAILEKSNIHSVYDESSMMSLDLTGFYVKEDMMFCRLEIENRSRINYDIDQFRMYIRDRKQSKRTASQEIEIQPLYISGDTSRIKGESKETLMVVVPKFTIPDGKYMGIEITERNGGRQLYLKVRNRHVVRAKLLSF